MYSPVPGFIRSLSALEAILRKGEAHCLERGLPPETVLEARLAPTMKPLTHQIRLACNTAAGTGLRLAGQPETVIEGAYLDFADLYARIAAARAVLGGLAPEAFAEAETRRIAAEPGAALPAQRYLMELGLPNFYFAMTTAYALLRLHGVPLGKVDFLG